MTAGTVPAMLLHIAAEHGKREALVDGQLRMDHAQLLHRAAVAAARLRSLGVEPGDRVAILLPNSWHYAVGYFGAQLAGAITVLVNTRFTGPEIEQVLTDSGAVLVLTDNTLGARIPPALAVRIVPVMEVTAAPDPTDAQVDPVDLPGTRRRPEDIAQLLYTSGTTGRPKGAMQTHGNLLMNARTVRENLGAAPGERTLIAAPMFHATGTAFQLIGFVSAGACCVFTPAFHAETAVELMADERITVFAGVAAMLRLIVLKAEEAVADLSDLRLFVVGGAPVPESFPAEIAERLPGLTLGNVWGLTEATSIVTYTDGAGYATHPWSVGKPVREVEVAVSVRGTPPQDLCDTVGELCVRGPNVTAGYWGDPEATAATFVDGWLHTGDIGSIDADGFVRILDRSKDMIIRGGGNIYNPQGEEAPSPHPPTPHRPG